MARASRASLNDPRTTVEGLAGRDEDENYASDQIRASTGRRTSCFPGGFTEPFYPDDRSGRCCFVFSSLTGVACNDRSIGGGVYLSTEPDRFHHD